MYEPREVVFAFRIFSSDRHVVEVAEAAALAWFRVVSRRSIIVNL